MTSESHSTPRRPVQLYSESHVTHFTLTWRNLASSVGRDENTKCLIFKDRVNKRKLPILDRQTGEPFDMSPQNFWNSYVNEEGYIHLLRTRDPNFSSVYVWSISAREVSELAGMRYDAMRCALFLDLLPLC